MFKEICARGHQRAVLQ